MVLCLMLTEMLFHNLDVFTEKAVWPKVECLNTLLQSPLDDALVVLVLLVGLPRLTNCLRGGGARLLMI